MAMRRSFLVVMNYVRHILNSILYNIHTQRIHNTHRFNMLKRLCFAGGPSNLMIIVFVARCVALLLILLSWRAAVAVFFMRSFVFNFVHFNSSVIFRWFWFWCLCIFIFDFFFGFRVMILKRAVCARWK